MQQSPLDDAQLPRLEPGLTLLRPPGRRSAALHRLAVGALSARRGTALWVDARNNASSYLLYDLAPRRALAGLQVARAFTAYQHHALVSSLPRRATGDTTLVVAPCVASLYRDDDVPDYEARDLLESSLAVLGEVADVYDVAVLASAVPDDEATATAAAYADREIDCVETDVGFRYVGEDFETTAYWSAGYWQTTIPYWVDLLGAMGDAVPTTPAPDPTEVALA